MSKMHEGLASAGEEESSMKLGVVQMPLVEDIGRNEKRISAHLEAAASQGISLVGFPEMALTSYSPDVLKDPDLNERVETALARIQTACRASGIGVIIGHGFREGDKLFNRSTALLPDGRRLTYDKIHLAEMEQKYFTPGDKPLSFEFGGMMVGVIVCRDQNYPLLARTLRDEGAEALFILSAHYYKPKEARWKVEKNRALPIARAVETGMTVLVSNAVGSHLGMVSLGNSLIADPSGCVIVSANESDETILSADLPAG